LGKVKERENTLETGVLAAAPAQVFPLHLLSLNGNVKDSVTSRE
jgi:hypothetical protein